MELYKRIRMRREELGMSQEELANKMSYRSRSTIAKIESGANDIPQSKIIDFANALKTTPQFLMGWVEGSTTLSPDERNLVSKYTTLDDRGKHTVNTVTDMEYNRVHKPHLMVNAAHAIEGASEEDKQHDEDIMNDPREWE